MKFLIEQKAPGWAHRLIAQLDRFAATRTLPKFSVLNLPKATPAAQMIYVVDESGGAVPVFSDGANWRRTTDRAIVS